MAAELLGSEVGEGDVHGDANHPGAEGGAAVPGGEALDDLHHGVLREVRGGVGVGDHAETDGVEPVLVAGEEGGEGVGVAGLDGGDEIGVGEGGGLWRGCARLVGLTRWASGHGRDGIKMGVGALRRGRIEKGVS